MPKIIVLDDGTWDRGAVILTITEDGLKLLEETGQISALQKEHVDDTKVIEVDD